MSKIRKRDFVKRNFSAKRDLNHHADTFKSAKREPRGGKHGERVELEREVEKELNEEV